MWCLPTIKTTGSSQETRLDAACPFIKLSLAWRHGPLPGQDETVLLSASLDVRSYVSTLVLTIILADRLDPGTTLMHIYLIRMASLDDRILPKCRL
jgi:hypothetical protein